MESSLAVNKVILHGLVNLKFKTSAILTGSTHWTLSESAKFDNSQDGPDSNTRVRVYK